MNDYLGKQCPYCKTAFTEDDDVVICSVCDMPHHKECWIANQGCTTFGCLGTLKTPDEQNTSVTATSINYEDDEVAARQVTFCVNCGAKNSVNSSFCMQCGSRLRTAQSSAPHYTVSQQGTNGNFYNTVPSFSQNQNSYQSHQNTGAVSDDTLAAFVGNKREYYLQKFAKIKSQNTIVSWNWSSFLFSGFWFFYRKMYLYGGIIVGVSCLSSFINYTFGAVLSSLLWIVSGMIGNWLYYKDIEKKAGRLNNLQEQAKTQFISKNGGTNTNAVIGAALVYVVLRIFAGV